MDTSTSGQTDGIDFETVEIPEDPNETFIAHRYVDSDGNTVEKRMTMSEWPAYAKEKNL